MFDGTGLVAYVVAPGRQAAMMPLNELPGYMAETRFDNDFNDKKGHLRLILPDTPGQTDDETDAAVAGLQGHLHSIGLNVGRGRARAEFIPVDSIPTIGGASDTDPAAITDGRFGFKITPRIRVAVAAGTAGLYLALYGIGDVVAPLMLASIVSNVDRIVAELAYTVRMLRASSQDSRRVTWNEVAGGIAGKIIPALANIGVFATQYGVQLTAMAMAGGAMILEVFSGQGISGWNTFQNAMATLAGPHLFALTLLVGLSLSVETFHGIWVNLWNTFQSKIGRHRGVVYQNLFNLIYGQLINASYRTVAYITLGNVAPYWSFEYLKAIFMMTVIGTFIGTMGSRSLNELYEKGLISRKGRATIQQLRDLPGMLVGPYVGTGDMFWAWVFFSLMQTGDTTLTTINARLQTRPIIHIAAQSVADSDAFQNIYMTEKKSPFQDGVDALTSSILVQPFVAVYNWLKGVAARRRP